MGKRRPQLDPHAPWEQLKLRLTSDEQFAYELIRPVVLFGASLPERALETETPERTLRRKVVAFEQDGMRSLCPAEVPKATQRLPDAVRTLVLRLHAEHPPMRPNEIATICYVRLGHHPSPHTIKRLLAQAPAAPDHRRRFAPYHQIPDPAERRRAIVVLHADGWNKKSIAAYLQISRQTVYSTLERWVREGLAGLPHKSRARHPGVRKATLRAVQLIRRLQTNPHLGAWRMAAALKQQGILLSPRTCGRIMAVNRDLYADLAPPARQPRTPRAMPYATDRRHHIWSVDVRYLDTPAYGGGQVYCISILENASRAIVASAVSRTQDLPAFLMVLYAAVLTCGSPEVLLSDSGAIFRAKRAKQIYANLGIRKEYIAKRQPWQSYIETTFTIQRRMADAAFAEATTWAEVVAVHERWVADYNVQDHWAHRFRRDARSSPTEVLAWVRGTHHDEQRLKRMFYTLRFVRRIDRAGYVQFRHWKLYSEGGAAGADSVLWLYRQTLTLTTQDETMATYTVQEGRGVNTLDSVSNPVLYRSRVRPHQQTLGDLPESDWRCVAIRLTRRIRRWRRRPTLPDHQLVLPLDEPPAETAA